MAGFGGGDTPDPAVRMAGFESGDPAVGMAGRSLELKQDVPPYGLPIKPELPCDASLGPSTVV